MNIDKLIASTEFEEGFRQFPYRCTQNKLTIGIGFNLDDVGLSYEESMLILRLRLEYLAEDVKKKFPYLDIKDEAWEILIEMAYQMGLKSLGRFKNMISALCDKDYLTASQEMLNSRWARQTPYRAERLANRMKGLQ